MFCIVGAIDIGSNGIRMSVTRCTARGNIENVVTQREAVRLGADVFAGGIISQANIDRVTAAIRGFKDIFEMCGAQRVRAVATSAMREAKNARVLIEKVRRETGIEIEVIGGDEEARLIYLAVANVIDISKKPTLMIDIGGGSVETTFVVRGNVVASESTPTGSVRLLQRMNDKKLSPKLFQRLVREYAKELRHGLKKEITGRSLKQSIGTGGNIETFGDLRGLLLGKSDTSFITRKELDKIIQILNNSSLEKRITQFCLRPDRADVIIPAGIILQSILREAKVAKVLIPRVGLREGVILDLARAATKSNGIRSLREERTRLHTLAVAIGRRFNFNEAHAERVMQFSGYLFDATRGLHKLNGRNRLLLEIAALLHDIGHCVSIENHHKHSFYLLKETPFVGLAAREKLLVALIARYHRGGPPKNDHEIYATLSREEQQVVNRLSAILRIAEALDKQHDGHVRRVALRRRSNKIFLKLIMRKRALVERWAVEESKKLFESVFNVKVEVS